MFGKIVMEAALASHPGKIREMNEDMAYANGVYFNNVERPQFSISEIQTGRLLIYSVCDGMGGENAGEKASYEAVILLDDFCKNLEGIKNINQLIEQLKTYIKQANDKIYSLWADSTEGRMGTTFAGLAICGRRAVVLNLGDSRVYMMRKGSLSQITKDHTQAERLASLGLIRRDQIESHKGRNILTRHFGVPPEEGIMEADYSNIMKLKKGDMFLLCSDGLTDMVGYNRIKQILDKKIAVSSISRMLIEEALINGGKDNVTVVVLRVKGLNCFQDIFGISGKLKNMSA
jgi:protein phosphatase